MFSFITSNFTFCLAVISLICILVGYFHYGINPFYTFEEVKYRLDVIGDQHEQEHQKKFC